MNVPNTIKIKDETMEYMGSQPAMVESVCDFCDKDPQIQTPFHLYRKQSDGLAAFVCDACAKKSETS